MAAPAFQLKCMVVLHCQLIGSSLLAMGRDVEHVQMKCSRGPLFFCSFSSSSLAQTKSPSIHVHEADVEWLKKLQVDRSVAPAS
jgi:hypothetical protein